ncbi:cutinase family protein [Mycobacterium sp. PS03-16]|uniref:cutinase family protein n=1 Tax=Mycobacterium sp. PS03-16 TaxID=2559611 RepID=UPI001FD7A917|nr:cutinase family protein [Mycobacterium sp. PS03-16]
MAISVSGLLGPQAAGIASAAPQPACPDVEVVFARGTFEAPGVGAVGQAFVNALNARIGGQPVAVYGVNYPASLDFAAAANGVADASNEIQAIAASCPDTKIVLGGYSQGAAVAAYTTADAVPAGFTLPAGITGPMPPAIASHVAAVALFGTPDPWFLGLVDRGAPPITIGNLYAAKTIQLCNPGDPVCSPGGLNRAAHSAYPTNGAADQAAAFVANTLGPGAGAPAGQPV